MSPVPSRTSPFAGMIWPVSSHTTSPTCTQIVSGVCRRGCLSSESPRITAHTPLARIIRSHIWKGNGVVPTRFTRCLGIVGPTKLLRSTTFDRSLGRTRRRVLSLILSQGVVVVGQANERTQARARDSGPESRVK